MSAKVRSLSVGNALEDEAKLVEKARAGDEAALALLAELYAPRLLRFGKKLCGSTADAEDMMQQTLLSSSTQA